jgi:Stage II sporulation protein E (SpoIIE)
MPPIFISAEGEATRLPDGDVPVGLFTDATFQEHRVRVPRGSSIVVYTDGVSDALNSEGEEFGEERIMRCLTSLPRPINAEGICKHLAGKVAEWAGGADRSDDSTILALDAKAPERSTPAYSRSTLLLGRTLSEVGPGTPVLMRSPTTACGDIAANTISYSVVCGFWGAGHS